MTPAPSRRGRGAKDFHFELLLAMFSAWLRNLSECRRSRALAGLLRRVRANRWYLSASAVFTSTLFFASDFFVTFMLLVKSCNY